MLQIFSRQSGCIVTQMFEYMVCHSFSYFASTSFISGVVFVAEVDPDALALFATTVFDAEVLAILIWWSR